MCCRFKRIVPEDVRGIGSIVLLFLYRVVGLTLRPVYPRGKLLRLLLDRILGGSQYKSGRCGETIRLTLAEI
jgi:hypothetical protein